MIMLAFVVIAAINQVGVQTTSLIAVMGAAGLAVGLALQGNKVISIYNVSDGVVLQTLSGHQDHVQSLAFSPRGELLVSGSRDKSVHLWKTK